MAEKTLKTIRIKWVRSGIGFTYRQKEIVHSLGLNKLNHTVVRPDTPQIRGIVASVPHLLEIIPDPPAAPWASVPEYTVHGPVVASAEPAVGAEDEVAGEGAAVAGEVAEPASACADQEKTTLPEGTEPAEASKE